MNAGIDIQAWLRWAQADAERRSLPELKPLLDALARSTGTLRAADFNDDASAARGSSPSPR